MKKILFVCHGNICRSPMAEFVFAHLASKAGLEVEVASAATSCEEIGNDTHPGTKNELSKHGVSFAPRKARQIRQSDYDSFDFIIGMDSANIANLRRFFGNKDKEKIFKLLSFCGDSSDVADPWYTGDFEKTYDNISRACEALLNKLLNSRI